jgi:hypothetical protein
VQNHLLLHGHSLLPHKSDRGLSPVF